MKIFLSFFATAVLGCETDRVFAERELSRIVEHSQKAVDEWLGWSPSSDSFKRRFSKIGGQMLDAFTACHNETKNQDREYHHDAHAEGHLLLHHHENIFGCSSKLTIVSPLGDLTHCLIPVDYNSLEILRKEPPCVEGITFGIKDDLVWTQLGCSVEVSLTKIEAEFSPEAPVSTPKPEVTQLTLRCESEHESRKHCNFEGDFNDFYLTTTLGEASCKRDVSYGFSENMKYIWVDEGCFAEFLLFKRERKPQKSTTNFPATKS
ncbi:Oidioi.mRNA.OKI2018_I69.chr1.g1264.t1.cds [Oikopleura dioica]|uniref:Oidioi.mRNA.OKI2018_I69.chr1.g1264.t1.cds n=1 Tax=Oikopleura dioica TaxID=34765 RepID=A0ABN7SMD2_OIKDI|nr:Oidioi.mRNA.OKI2018_I69.chr1.g1264.t1.cds [Oikopleura dioica]